MVEVLSSSLPLFVDMLINNISEILPVGIVLFGIFIVLKFECPLMEYFDRFLDYFYTVCSLADIFGVVASGPQVNPDAVLSAAALSS